MTFSSVVDKEVETPGMAAVVSYRTLVVSRTSSPSCYRAAVAGELTSF